MNTAESHKFILISHTSHVLVINQNISGKIFLTEHIFEAKYLMTENDFLEKKIAGIYNIYRSLHFTYRHLKYPSITTPSKYTYCGC